MECYSVARSGVRQESSAIIYQQNPINMICQGANSHISIANSKAIQIGHGNVMSMHCGDPGKKRVLDEGGERTERGLGPQEEGHCFTSLGTPFSE